MKPDSLLSRAVVLALACALAACSSTKVLRQPSPERAARHLERGDEIVILTKSRSAIELTVARIDNDAIVGETQTVPFAEIQAIKYKRFSGGKTLALVGVTYLAIAVVIGEAMEEAFSCWFFCDDDD